MAWVWMLRSILHPKDFFVHFIGIFPFILLCAISQALYGIWQWGQSSSAMSGSFDNPAGLASLLAFSLPFGCYGTESRNPLWRYASVFGVAVLTVAILLTESRSGILSAAVVLALYFLKRAGKHRKKLVLFGSIVCLAGSVFMYLHKKDSADGRLLIWLCSCQMVKDKPWSGHGFRGFQSSYMDYQAQYFREHSDSRYVLLADDVKHPFNEYLLLLVSLGFIGAFFFLAIIVLLIRAWRIHPHGSSDVAALCLVAVAIFSLFSYPFRYPHTWILCACSVIILTGNARMVSRKAVPCLLFCVALGLSVIPVS